MHLSLGFSIGCRTFPAVAGLDPGTPLLAWADGQYNRQQDTNVVPAYQTSAVALTLGSADTMRLEDTGDGNGALLLLEGQRRCININSRAISAWTAANSASAAANTENGPEGALTADAVTFPNTTIGNMNQTQTAGNVASGASLRWQVWAKSGTGGAEKFRFWLTDKAASNVPVSADMSVTTTWQRFTWDVSAGVGAGNPVFRLGNASDAAARGAGRIVVFSGICVEAAAYPSSLILNESGSPLGKRDPDIMIFQPAQVPLHLRTGKWASGIRTKWASADLVAADERWLYSFGDSGNGLRARHTGTDVRLEAVVSGSVVASSGAVTATRGGYLPIIVDCAAGVLTVNGVAGSAGSPIVWPSGALLRLGGIVGSSGSEADCAIKAPEVAA
jgi:hypothetical protein